MKTSNKLYNNFFIFLFFILLIFISFKVLNPIKNKQPDSVLSEGLAKNLRAIIYTQNGCSYCDMAKDFLEKNNVSYEVIDLGDNPAIRQKLINQTGQVTVPYIFINDRFIGGYSNLVKLKKDNKIVIP